jgi:hypothetical protein
MRLRLQPHRPVRDRPVTHAGNAIQVAAPARDTEGSALFLRTYRHLYEGEKRAQAERFGAQVQAALDEEWTDAPSEPELGLNSGDAEWAHLGLNQGPLACEASALPLSYAPGTSTG